MQVSNSDINANRKENWESKINEDDVKEKAEVVLEKVSLYINNITDIVESLSDINNSREQCPDTECSEILLLKEDVQISSEELIYIENIPDYQNDAYVTINNNIPYFTSDEKLMVTPFEYYSELDDLGRCGVAYANLCPSLMPTEERGEIGMIKPSGWQTVKYEFVDGKYLYNRCHLIGYQLSGENANEKNLITGTRYLNIEGMLPFENLVADYIHETGHHVLYRVTPIFEDNNLVADGVQMEGWSVEDNGKNICFNIYAYNVQPGVEIDYSTGKNWEMR